MARAQHERRVAHVRIELAGNRFHRRIAGYIPQAIGGVVQQQQRAIDVVDRRLYCQVVGARRIMQFAIRIRRRAAGSVNRDRDAARECDRYQEWLRRGRPCGPMSGLPKFAFAVLPRWSRELARGSRRTRVQFQGQMRCEEWRSRA